MLYCVRFKSSASLIKTCNEPTPVPSTEDEMATSSCLIATNKLPLTCTD